MRVTDEQFAERKEAGRALMKEILTLVQLQHAGEAIVASIGGFDLEYSGERIGRDGYQFRTMLLRTNSEQEVNLPMTVTPLGAIARLENSLDDFEVEQERYRQRLADARRRLASYQSRGRGNSPSPQSSPTSAGNSPRSSEPWRWTSKARPRPLRSPPRSARSAQAVLVIDQLQPGWGLWSPAPEHEVQIVDRGARCETADQQSVIAILKKPAREGLRSRLAGGFHLVAPRRVGERGSVHLIGKQRFLIAAVEGVLDVSVVGHQRCRLQVADLICLPQSRHDRQGCVEGRRPLPVEPTAIEFRAATR